MDKELADSIHAEEEIALVDGESGEILAVMDELRHVSAGRRFSRDEMNQR